MGVAIAGTVIGFLFVKLVMSSSYETSVLLKYEGEPYLGVGDPHDSSYGLSPASDALRLQSVLRKIREETGFDISLTHLGEAIDYGIDLQAGTLRFNVLGETAEDAAQFARTVTDVFLKYHKERQSKRIEEEIQRTKMRIEAAQAEGSAARRQYNQFREEHGISALPAEQESMLKSAASLRANSELTSLEIRVLEAKVKSLEIQLASTPKMSVVSEGSSPERATYNRLREQLVSAKSTLSADHPQVQSLQQQVDQLRAQLATKGGQSPGGSGLVSLNTTYQAVQMQLREARSALEGLRERQRGLSDMAGKAQQQVESFSDIEGEASALLADVHLNEALLGKLYQTEAVLEDALRDPPSGFVVLDPGAIPEYPVRNKMKIVVFLAIVIFSVVLALFLVLRPEFRGLRLKTPAEIAFWGNAPVVAATSWPNDARGLDELVASFDDFVPETRGNLLILGALPSEAGLTKELADRMSEDWRLPPEPMVPPTTAPITTPPPRSPVHAPPPAGPYPIHRKDGPTPEPAERPSIPRSEALQLVKRPGDFLMEAWAGPAEGQALRRAARLADRVLILVRSGAMSALQLHTMRHRIGREAGIGYVVVGLPDDLRAVPDRAGNVAAFWRS